jgi:hypothetical protein
MATKYSPHAVRRLLTEISHQYPRAGIGGHWVEDADDDHRNRWVAGDLIVRLTGREPGALSWDVNAGSVLPR